MLLKPDPTAVQTSAPPELSFAEFVALIALMMAVTALSIDIMLPALPEIGKALGVGSENERQFIISAYLAGFASGQLIFGPVSDSYGRRNPLLFGLGIYIAATIFAIFSTSLPVLLAARVLQGFGAASPRVIAMAIVRDRFGGRNMARVMSFVMMVFIVVPVLAPAVGAGIIHFATWPAIFMLLLIAACCAATWASLRLPETRPAGTRLPLSVFSVLSAARIVITTRQTGGYMVAAGFIFGLLMSYITSAEQVFVDVYKLGPYFPVVFGAIASFMIAASIVNASVVRRLGMRVVSHRALLGLVAACGAMALAGYPEKPPLILFCAFIAVVFFCFGLIMPNFNALAMEPAGHIAGTASSLIGFYTTAAGAAFGSAIGQAFEGSVRPLCIGVTLLAICSLAVVLWVERFKLAQPSVANAMGSGS